MFGVSEMPGGGAVQARTYFHFPMSVFPPGTDILQATLSVYADSVTSEGKGVFGLYRAVADWTEQNGGADPQDWPALLPAAISLTEVSFDLLSRDVQRSSQGPGDGQAAGADVVNGEPASSRAGGLLLLQAQQPTAILAATPLPSSTAPITLSEIAGAWVTWDATALLRAWYRNDVPNQGLAIAAGPVADADPQEGGNVVAARWLTANDRRTQPHLVVHVEVRPVTPTPSPIFCLPAAGPLVAPGGWSALLPLLVGAVLLLVGLAARRR
jgi:hypothetical protein